MLSRRKGERAATGNDGILFLMNHLWRREYYLDFIQYLYNELKTATCISFESRSYLVKLQLSLLPVAIWIGWWE